MPWLLLVLGCDLGDLGRSGELWLQLDAREPGGDRFTLTLPATSLREAGAPATLETVDGPVDLRDAARDVGYGDARTWTLPDDGTATLSHRPAAEGVASEVSFGITGKKGRTGLSLNVPLRPEDLDPLRKRARLDVDLDLPVELDAAACAQWKRSPPMPILEIVGPNGNGLVIATR